MKKQKNLTQLSFEWDIFFYFAFQKQFEWKYMKTNLQIHVMTLLSINNYNFILKKIPKINTKFLFWK